ncbi:glycosyltransferase [Methylobacterium sp. E-041]|uniref:glycosyltransferase family 2 protein n=1 Tax=Methylobacterium sp. E-041 TaxID=2836573 RepID=UPI001FB97786|nr:glycosyltransferase family 2 protein [Methylobacterium sp. E-041]MCJ2108157.1 glycosyltransferase [Methylobacterium sp. E-041]
MSVTVIVPTHNRAKYIEACIGSVLAQSHEDFELIVVDDASTDGTHEILAALVKKDARIRLLRHPTNRGGPAARNLGLSLAKYDLIACMDDDDIMLPDRLKSQIRFMEENPDVSVLSSAAYMIDVDNKIIGKSVPTIDMERGLARKDPGLIVNIIHPTAMYRRDVVLGLGGYRNYLLDDRDLWGRMATAGFKIAVSPEPVLMHRRHSSIMTTRINEIFENGDFIDFNMIRRLNGNTEISLEQYREMLHSQSIWKKCRNWRLKRSAVAYRIATLHYSSGNWLPFMKNLAVALSLNPSKYVVRTIAKKGKYLLRKSTPKHILPA